MTEEQIEAAMADPECARANEICRLAAATVADRLREECDGFDNRQAAAAAERSVDARAGLLRGDSGTVGQGRQPRRFRRRAVRGCPGIAAPLRCLANGGAPMNQQDYVDAMRHLMGGIKKLTADIEEGREQDFPARRRWDHLKGQKLSAVFEVARLIKRMQDTPGIKMTPVCEAAGMSFQEAYKHLWMLEEFDSADEVRELGIYSRSGAIKAAADIRRMRRKRMAAVA